MADYRTSTNNYDTAVVPVKRQIPQEIELQASALEVVFKLMEELEQRLVGVMRPNSPAEDSAKEQAQFVDLAQQIHSNTQMIQRLNSRIQGIMSRLEI